MQNHSFHTDFIQFKDEIFKKVRLLENRLSTDINNKFTETHIMCDTINNKLSTLSHNNNSLLELLTSQKLNLDKIEALERSMKNLEQNLLTYDVKMKKVIADIEYLSSKCDKIMTENLHVTGHIGPGCQFKNISEYIKQNIQDFSKMKIEKEKLRIENKIVKSKIDNIIKNSSTLIDKAIFSCQNYSDEKYSDIKNLLENRTVEINTKNLELRALIDKADLDNKKNTENIITQFEQFKNIKDELINITDNKIKEINEQIEKITQEIKSLKANKDEIIKTNRKKMINMNISNKFLLNSPGRKKNNNSIINKESPQKNSSREKINFNNINSINSNSNESIKVNKSDENRNINNEIKIKEENSQIIKPIYNKIEEERKDDNNIIKDNIVINDLVKDLKIDEENNKKNEISENTSKNENKENNNSNIKDITEQEKPKIFSESLKDEIKEENILFKKIDPIITSKIIEKKENQKNKATSTIDISYNNKEENKLGLIKSLSYNLKITKENNIKMSKTIFSEKEKSDNEFPSVPKLVKKENVNKMKMLSPRQSLDFNNIKSERRKFEKKFFSQNEKQKQVMDYIKLHYNIMKEKQDQKSQENVVNCNIINLHLEQKNKRKQKNSSARIFINNSKKRNTFSEFGMKLSPAFGRTNYNFYIKDKLQESLDEIKTGIPKIHSLKTTLNAAFVCSIKNKIFFSDKGNNFS